MPAASRIIASLIDLAFVLAWALLVAGVLLVLGLRPDSLGVVLTWLVLAVVPALGLLTLMESGPYEATVGKYRMGLRVRTVRGERVRWPRSAVRNLLKLGAPFSLALLSLTAVIWSGYEAIAGLLLVAVVLVSYLVSVRSGQALYDRLLGTTVIQVRPARRVLDSSED